MLLKKANVVILILNKRDFKLKIKQRSWWYFMFTFSTINHDDILINFYLPRIYF